MTRLTKNIIYNVTGQSLVLILSLVAVRFLFRRLGDDVFGIVFFNIVLTQVLSSALYASLIRGRQMMHLSNGIDVGASLTQQGGLLIVLLAGGGIYAVAGWISISALLAIAAYMIMSARLFDWRSLAPSWSLPVIRRNLGFSSQMMVISSLALVHTQAGQVVVSKLLPIAEFGFYSFIWSVVNRALLLAAAVAQAAFPSFSELFAAGDQPRLLQQYRKLQDLVCYG